MFGDFQSLKPNPDEHRIQPIEASHLALSYFEFIPLRGENFQVFLLSYLLSLCLGKLLRYGYWRWALRGQLV